uniref:Uncharacterized protein n=1 Tax=Haptolina brevifila TaxID=156173 RepID=A0A7S2BAI5_9EUKA
MSKLLENGANPHIQKFMERKAPKGFGSPRANVKMPEEQTNICYPKEGLRDTILMKSMPMHMACKRADEVVRAPDKQEVYGRSKSDITTGHENLYERSYYGEY